MIFASCSPSSNFSVGGFGAFLSIQGLLKTAFDKSLTNPLDGLTPTAESFGDPAVGPSGAVRVGLQQNLGTSHLLAAALELLDHLLQAYCVLASTSGQYTSSAWDTSVFHAASHKIALRPIPIFSCDKALEAISEKRLPLALTVYLRPRFDNPRN